MNWKFVSKENWSMDTAIFNNNRIISKKLKSKGFIWTFSDGFKIIKCYENKKLSVSMALKRAISAR